MFMKTLLYQKLNGYLNKKFGLLKKNNYIFKHIETIKSILVINQNYGQLVSETFLDETQHKMFLKILHTAIAHGNDFNTYNGKDFFIHVPNGMLKECLILGQTQEVSMSDVVVAKSKLEM